MKGQNLIIGLSLAHAHNVKVGKKSTYYIHIYINGVTIMPRYLMILANCIIIYSCSGIHIYINGSNQVFNNINSENIIL